MEIWRSSVTVTVLLVVTDTRARHEERMSENTALEKILKTLNPNKAKDPSLLSNMIFRNEIAGDKLKESLIIFFNKMKHEQISPKQERSAASKL